MNKNISYIALKNMSARKKDILLSLIMLTITGLIVFIGFSFFMSLDVFLKRVVHEIPLAKTFVFSVNESQKEALRTDTEIEANLYLTHVFGELSDERFSKGLVFNFYQQGYDAFIQDKGAQLTSEGLLLPKYYLPDVNYDDNAIFSEQPNFIDASQFIGEWITVNFINDDNGKATQKMLKITGTYDNSLTFDDPQQALISYALLKEIHEELDIQNTGQSYYYVTVDQYKQMNSVHDYLRQTLKIETQIKPVFNFSSLTTFIGFSKGTFLLIGALLFVSCLIYISSSTVKNVERRTVELGLLKVLGYTPRQIKRIFIMENLIITTSAFLLSVILYAISVLSYNLGLKNLIQFQLQNIRIEFHLFFILVSFVFFIALIYGISAHKVKAIENLESIDILKMTVR